MPNPARKTSPTKTITVCALLAAISIVMARLLSFATPGGVRWSLDKFPLFLAGMLFGPLMGGLTGFAADSLGSLMQFGFNPILCPPAVLYGVIGGLFRWYLKKNPSIFRLAVSYLCPIVFGSILYQSCALTYLYFDGTFREGLIYYLSTRSVQFAIMLVVEVSIIYSLMKFKVFSRLGLWSPVKRSSQ
ncbi:MAG: folate family ECF transporter S component [Oscillospiraceae bacterium]|nr:folate family ECF transporter S component [Oscillospiraceae bacterium]